MKAVELKNVSFSYNGKDIILDNINFDADFGKITLVAGHSGDGKSTLLSIISGIIPNVNYGELSGEVLINGASTKDEKLGTICRKVGMVLQNADEQIINKLVEDEIAFGLENLAFSPENIKKQVDIVCNLLKLNSQDTTFTLSGGQKQRLITASALSMGQKIILFDEPLANLDKEGANLLMQICRSLTKQGYCVIIVEHRLDIVLPFVDCVWHMKNKKIEVVEDKEKYLSEQTKKIADICDNIKTNDILFNVKDIGYAVKKKDILSHLSCAIKKGERTVILGENGCGKTTFLRVLARLYKPTSGEIEQFIDEKLGKKASKKWFKKVGFIYQNPDYQLFMPTVKQELTFKAFSEDYAMSIAQKFGIEHLLDKHPHSLSEGQKRRVSIAAVVATKPEVLLLDEPTVGQDYHGLNELVNVLNEIHQEEHNTMITITHDVRCCEALCDNAILIKDKKVEKVGGKELVREYFNK